MSFGDMSRYNKNYVCFTAETAMLFVSVKTKTNKNIGLSIRKEAVRLLIVAYAMFVDEGNWKKHQYFPRKDEGLYS